MTNPMDGVEMLSSVENQIMFQFLSLFLTGVIKKLELLIERLDDILDIRRFEYLHICFESESEKKYCYTQCQQVYFKSLFYSARYVSNII